MKARLFFAGAALVIGALHAHAASCPARTFTSVQDAVLFKIAGNRPAAPNEILLGMAHSQYSKVTRKNFFAGPAANELRVASALADTMSLLAIRDYLETFKDKYKNDRTFMAVLNGVKVAYAPMGDADNPGDEDLVKELRDAQTKKRVAAKVLSQDWPRLGVPLLVESIIYNEPVSKEIALSMACLSAPDAVKKVEKIEGMLAQ